MITFIKELKEEELLLQRPDVVGFAIIGEEDEILVLAVEYIYNIRPAIGKMLLDIKDEELEAYVKRANILIVGAQSVADVYSESDKCVIGSMLQKGFTFGIDDICTVGEFVELEDNAAVALLQEKVDEILGGEFEENED